MNNTNVERSWSFESDPKRLYVADDFLEGYDQEGTDGYAASWDFRVFKEFVADGGGSPKLPEVRQRQALHDAAIANALRTYLNTEPVPKLVGVMGGHAIQRNEPVYRSVASLGRSLTRAGYLVVTGGGPGIMEAAHVGAFFANDADELLDKALERLGSNPGLPDLTKVLDENGKPSTKAKDLLQAVKAWLNSALEVRKFTQDPGVSLAIPTWLFGQEPTMPFATHYAKYFQNSIREETLVTEARAGIVYARGGGGTVREIFEDAESNYYVDAVEAFTPMIFFDLEEYWQHDSEWKEEEDKSWTKIRSGIKLDQAITSFVLNNHGKKAKTCLDKILFTADETLILEALRKHAPVGMNNLRMLLNGSPLASKTTTLAFNRLDRSL